MTLKGGTMRYMRFFILLVFLFVCLIPLSASQRVVLIEGFTRTT